jgi:oligopeptide transport system substrate-binding protein
LHVQTSEGRTPVDPAKPPVPNSFFLKWPPASLAWLAVLSLLWAGCGGLSDRADLVIINGAEPESLDPALITGQADGRIVMALFEGLTRYHPKDATPSPGWAEAWEISPDGRTYTFFLRTNAVFSDGKPITAEDFVWSWRRVLDPETACEYASVLFHVRGGEEFATGKLDDFEQVGIRALDRLTFQVELNEPTPFFLDLCGFHTLAVVPRQAIEKHGDAWLKQRPLPVSGAYMLESWRVSDRVRLRKNPLYWDAENTHIERVDLLTCVNPNTALNLYESGAADIVWDKDLIPMSVLDVVAQRPDFHRYDYLGSYFFRFNVTHKPFDDPRVRKAFALATDKQRIVEKITRAGERPAGHLVPPGVANYQSPAGLGYDPEKARRLLAEAGYPNGEGFPRFHYTYNSLSAHENIAVELREMWRRELGVQMELRQMEWKVFLQAQNRLDYHLSRSSWIGDYNDANTFLELFMTNNGNNRTGWSHPEYDRLLRLANAEADVARRADLLRQAERILVEEELPIVPLYIYVGLVYFNPELIDGIYFNIRAEHPLRAIRKRRPDAKRAGAGGHAAALGRPHGSILSTEGTPFSGGVRPPELPVGTAAPQDR